MSVHAPSRCELWNRAAFVPLLGRILVPQISRQCAQITHEVPNVIRGLDLTERWHSSEANSVLNDPKQLAVRIALHLRTSEIGRTWIHPSPGYGLSMPISSVTEATIRAVVSNAVANAGFCGWKARWNSLPACASDKKTCGPVGDARFETTRFLQRRQVEMC